MEDFLQALRGRRLATLAFMMLAAMVGPPMVLPAMARPGGALADPGEPVLAPLGVPTRDVGTPENPRELPASFRVRVALPAFLGPEVKLDLVSLGPGGEPIDGAGELAGFPGAIPKAAFLGEDGLVLRRLSDRPTDEGAHWYESDVVVAIADLRAARAYTRTPAENAANNPGGCVRCDRAALGIPAAAREILSGETIRARYPAALVAQLASIYDEATLRAGEPTLRSVRWEIAPSLRQEPARNASGGSGDVVPGTLLHSGEFTQGAVDLAVRGRSIGGMDFAFARSYRNQTIGSGPLGPGWDFGYRMRLRALPDGSVELYDGGGRRERFTRQGDDSLKSPPGVFAELTETPEGYLLIDPSHTVVRFDRWGRLAAIADAVRDRATTGNELRFEYDRASHLARVVDALGRRYDLDYDDAGHLERVSDFDGRAVRYEYDDEGRLARVTSPAITIGEATFPAGLTTDYEYAESAPVEGGLAVALATRDNLVALHDAREDELDTPWEITYTDADGDGRAEEATAETWGGFPLAIEYDFGGHRATVTDRRENAWQYQHNSSGQLLRLEDPTGAATAYVVDGEGLVTQVTLPLGRVTDVVYDTGGQDGGDRRARGNVLSVSVTADSRGDNGSAHILKTTYEYEGYANRPTRIVDPRGAVTKIVRNAVGLPTSVTEAEGTPDAGATATEYNDYGQPTKVTNPNGHVTIYAYFATGPEKGYLQKQTVDPEGLALVTAFDVDPRGNVTAVTDPRGVRHESVYNEADWLVESTQAASGATSDQDPEGLAPALGYRTVYLYDEVGQLVEERLPVGEDGSSYTVVQRDYGVLGEMLEERREVNPGVFVTTTTEYDAAFHPIRITHPEGNFEEWEYDSRNLMRFHRRGLGTGALAAPIQTEMLYNAEGENVGSIDGRRLGWERRLDGFGRPFRNSNPLDEYEETRYDTGGMPSESRRVASGSLLARQVTEYDRRGRPKSSKSYLWETGGNDPRIPDDPGSALALETKFEWDAGSQLRQTIDPLQRATLVEYDAAGRRVAVRDAAGNRMEWTLDSAGDAVETKSQEKTSTGAVVEIVSTAAFDALGRPVAAADAFGNRSRRTYDARGNVRLEMDAEGALTTSTHDGLDRLTESARPEGILERFEYDDNGRLIAHSDALDQRTTYTYDAANRLTSTTHPDSGQEVFEEYDGNDNLLSWRDANDSHVSQLFDGANRVRGRSIERGAGVIGVAAESFDFDGLSRLVRTQAGSIVSTFSYDSLSRTTSESSDGRKTTYLRDDAGNVTAMIYPSGLTVLRQFDELDRTKTVGTSGGPSSLAQFRYRGAGRVAGKDLGPAILGRSSFDAAGRTTFRSAVSPLASLLSEQTSYSPRGLATATTRWDLEGDGQIYRHDDAGRLLLTEEAARAATTVANNSVPAPANLDAIGSGFGFDYTPTDHMILQAEKQAGILTRETLLPSDSSGRNRPAFANGKALAWDANGNLTAKGAVHYEYDFHNRLVRVTEDGVGELASYDYDAQNRRISRAVAGEEHPTVWSGWQAIEEYGDDGLEARRVYGLGLDEIVRAEVDLDDDGTVETIQRPIYDRIGNLVVLADELGKPVERYTYKPYGPEKTEADLTPPQLMQIRRSEFGAIEFDSSEGISGEALRRSLEEGAPIPGFDGTLDGQTLRVSLGDPEPEGLAGPVPFTGATGSTGSSAAHLDGEPGPHATLTQRSIPGRDSGRTWILTFDDPVPAGANVTLTFHPAGIQDDFANPLAAPVTQAFTWPSGAAVLLDTAPPEVERITATFGGVEVLFSEPIDSATLPAAVTVDGQTFPWVAAGSEYRYRAAIALPPGPHQVQVNTQLHDLAGTAPTAAASYPFSIQAAGGKLVYERPNPDEIPASAAKNPYGSQGLPRDPETGFLYVRNRYFDPEIGRFITADPLGFVDGPSEYAFAGNSPANAGDPLGLLDDSFLTREERAAITVKSRLDRERSRQAQFEACAEDATSLPCQDPYKRGLIALYGDPVAGPSILVASRRYPTVSPIVYVNGIQNDRVKARRNAIRASVQFAAPVIDPWNRPRGFFTDLAEVALNKSDLIDASTQLTIKTIREFLPLASSTFPLRVLGHSQGEPLSASALNHLRPEERALVSFRSYGGAAIEIPTDIHSALRTVNQWDLVPNLSGYLLGRAGGRFDGRVAIRRFSGLSRGDLISHGLDLYLDNELMSEPLDSPVFQMTGEDPNIVSYRRWFLLGRQD